MTTEKAIEILSDVGDINRCCAEDAEALDMAIKALEEVSRLPENLHGEREQAYMNGYADGKSTCRWFSVDDKLPDYGVSVLTWDGDCYCVEKRIPYIRDEDGEPISSDWWVSDEYDENDSDYYPNLRDGACIAWMPLPEWGGVGYDK